MGLQDPDRNPLPAMTRVSPHLDRLAFSMLAGVLLATLAVNLAPGTYYDVIEARLLPDLAFLPVLTPQLLVTQGLMALFLFVLGKEFYESLRLEGGPLAIRSTRRLMAAGLVGALALPLAFWLATGAAGLGDLPGGAGWSLTLGADLALALAFGRRLFGPNHPALPLLIFTALALDMTAAAAIGLERLFGAFAALWPQDGFDTENRIAGALRLLWLLPAAAALLTYARGFARHAAPMDTERHHRRAEAATPILLTAAALWICTLMAGLPAALALLPLIPLIPHAARSLGLFAEAESLLHDPLNRIEARLLPLLPAFAFLFGLVAGAIDLGALGADTLRAAVAGLLRPLGLVLGCSLALAFGQARLPWGVTRADIGRIGLLLVPGLTLPFLALDQGLGGGGLADAARGGLGLTLLAAPITLALSRRRRTTSKRP